MAAFDKLIKYILPNPEAFSQPFLLYYLKNLRQNTGLLQYFLATYLK